MSSALSSWRRTMMNLPHNWTYEIYFTYWDGLREHVELDSYDDALREYYYWSQNHRPHMPNRAAHLLRSIAVRRRRLHDRYYSGDTDANGNAIEYPDVVETLALRPIYHTQ